MRNSAMVFIGISGCLAVILGAFGAHSLGDKVQNHLLDPKDLHAYETAVHYQLFHTLALLGIFAIKDMYPLYNRLIGILFMTGIICFSGSIYALVGARLAGTDIAGWIWPVTPLGGLLLIGGWACLAMSAHKQVTK